MGTWIPAGIVSMNARDHMGWMRTALLAVIMFLAATVSLAYQEKSAPKSSTPSIAPVPRLTYNILSAIQRLANGKSTYDFLGLSDYGNNSSRLYVTSARALIAFKTAKASESNARYTPPANERLDTVSISCGDSDIGEIFECSRVRVMNREKRVIKPSLMPPTFSTFHLSLKQA